MLSREWRCSWRSADRRCSNYIWVINNLIAYLSESYIRDLMVYFANTIVDDAPAPCVTRSSTAMLFTIYTCTWVLFFRRKSFNYLCELNVEKWWTKQIYFFHIFQKYSTGQGSRCTYTILDHQTWVDPQGQGNSEVDVPKQELIYMYGITQWSLDNTLGDYWYNYYIKISFCRNDYIILTLFTWWFASLFT